MKRIKMIVSYDGTEYHGWQTQKNLKTGTTVQQALEKAIPKLVKEDIKVIASGRTDKGVHALGQVVHFDTISTIPAERFPIALKKFLPENIVIVEASEVDSSFHARYNAKNKTYRYTIDNNFRPNVLKQNYSYHYSKKVNLEKMKEAAKYLVGTHDFRSFCASNTKVKDFIRTIYQIDIWENNKFIYVQINGNGFLYNMVRIIVGTLLKIGIKKIEPENIKKIIDAKNRNLAGETVPAKGLCLMKVEYNN